MTTWTQTSTIPGQRSWKRPLGTTEMLYYWDSICNGATDTVMHAHLRVMRPGDMDIYAPDNVRRAWLSVKRRFPLIAAEVHEEANSLHFVVREQNVTSLRGEDVTLGTVSSFCDAKRFITNNLDGPRPISPKLLARVYVFGRTDRPEHFHVVLTIAHCITDGGSTSTVLRTFFQTLATLFDPRPMPIEERLQMCFPIESQIFPDDLSITRRRWRRAIGYAFYVVRCARLTGGHTLPGNFTQATSSMPAKSRLGVVSFPRDVSTLILSNCRRHKITLNSAYHIFIQVALSRLLCRRYLRGEVSDEEWEYRKRQPMLSIGLVNLRPYYRRDWFNNGGSGEVGLNFSFYQQVLPFMPLGVIASENIDHVDLVDGAPLFQDLMSFDRFLLRCELTRSNCEKLFRNPRFLEICIATHSDPLEEKATRAANWRRTGGRAVANAETNWPLASQACRPVFTQRGASLGNMDDMIPLDYPMPASHPLSPLSPFPHPHRAGYPAWSVPDDVVLHCETPRLHVEYWQTYFRSRPGELYVGAVTSREQLQYFSFYDENVYSTDIVQELLGEMKGATLWYLGRPQEEVATKVKSKL